MTADMSRLDNPRSTTAVMDTARRILRPVVSAKDQACESSTIYMYAYRVSTVGLKCRCTNTVRFGILRPED